MRFLIRDRQGNVFLRNAERVSFTATLGTFSVKLNDQEIILYSGSGNDMHKMQKMCFEMLKSGGRVFDFSDGLESLSAPGVTDLSGELEAAMKDLEAD